MNITPQEEHLVFHFKRVSPHRREISENGSPWKNPKFCAYADWGPESRSCDFLASQLINRVFQPDVPGYGRVMGWPAMDEVYKHTVVAKLLAGETRSEFEISSEAIIALAPARYTISPPLKRPQWPIPGERIRFRDVGMAFSPKYVEDAKRLLVPGTIYTISSIECASSSTKVSLLETGAAEFNYAWFDRL